MHIKHACLFIIDGTDVWPLHQRSLMQLPPGLERRNIGCDCVQFVPTEAVSVLSASWTKILSMDCVDKAYA